MPLLTRQNVFIDGFLVPREGVRGYGGGGEVVGTAHGGELGAGGGFCICGHGNSLIEYSILIDSLEIIVNLFFGQ